MKFRIGEGFHKLYLNIFKEERQHTKLRARNKMKQEKGITLIALVVTIVVLLILAGVTVTVLFGDSGIITMAQKAAKETQDAADKDKEDLAKLDEYLTSRNWGGSTNPTDPENPDKPPVSPETHVNPIKGEKVPAQTDGKTNVEWKETIVEGENEKILIAKIPVGFCVVKDLKDAEGNITDENNITNGLVISDVENDDLDNTAKGNQFVWIPVENMNNFIRIEGFYRGARKSSLSKCQEAGKEGDTISTEESRKMYQSVADNGGFYIARFEAGIPDTTTPNKSRSNVPTPDGVSKKPVSKKSVSPWNYIPWGGTTAKEASDGLQGNDNANGAVKVARSMYTKSNTCGVTSTLCYGVQWDAVMQFIEPNYLWKTGKTDNVPEDSVVRNGEGKGNYRPTSGSGELKVTGQYQQNHIYDLAGNVFEWTMEAYADSTDLRVHRGGGIYDLGDRYPASYRGVCIPDIDPPSFVVDNSLGLRVALYV